MSEFPEKYNLEYLLFQQTNSFSDIAYALEMPYIELYKRAFFAKYDSWLKESYQEMTNE